MNYDEPDVRMRVGYQLKRAQHQLHGAMSRSLLRFGVTLPQYAAMANLERSPGLSNAQLARQGFVTPQTMFRILRVLERRGWVTRPETVDQGRARGARLTAVGRQKLRACTRATVGVEDRLMERLGPDERANLLQLLLSYGV
jgi:DNA-binding MarR family transcriptional regulator